MSWQYIMNDEHSNNRADSLTKTKSTLSSMWNNMKYGLSVCLVFGGCC